MKKHQISMITFLALLPFLLVGCALSYTMDTTPTPDLSQTSTPIRQVPSPTLEVSTPTVLVIDTTTPAQALPDGDSALRTWDFGEEGLTIDSGFVTKYGRLLVVAFDNPTLMVYNFETDVAQVFESPVNFAFLDFANGISSRPDGILVAEYLLNEGGNVTLWQISNKGEGRVVANITETEYFVTSLAISPDGETLALGYNNGEIRLLRASDGVQTHTIQAHHDFVMSLAFSWDSRYLLSDSCCFDPFTYVFDISNGSKIATLATESYEPGRISFSPDNQFAAVTSYDGTHIISTSNWNDLGFIIPTFEGKFTCDSKGIIAIADERFDVHSVRDGGIIHTADAADTIPVHCLYDGRTITMDIDYQNDVITLFAVER